MAVPFRQKMEKRTLTGRGRVPRFSKHPCLLGVIILSPKAPVNDFSGEIVTMAHLTPAACQKCRKHRQPGQQQLGEPPKCNLPIDKLHFLAYDASIQTGEPVLPVLQKSDKGVAMAKAIVPQVAFLFYKL